MGGSWAVDHPPDHAPPTTGTNIFTSSSAASRSATEFHSSYMWRSADRWGTGACPWTRRVPPVLCRAVFKGVDGLVVRLVFGVIGLALIVASIIPLRTSEMAQTGVGTDVVLEFSCGTVMDRETFGDTHMVQGRKLEEACDKALAMKPGRAVAIAAVGLSVLVLGFLPRRRQQVPEAEPS